VKTLGARDFTELQTCGSNTLWELRYVEDSQQFSLLITFFGEMCQGVEPSHQFDNGSSNYNR
jgi:hypothetical protein